MTKRIVFLTIPLLILIALGLKTVQDFFSSFPKAETVIESLTPSESVPASIDMTESYFDDSGSMKGYYNKQYVQFLRILKSHIRERGKYQFYSFSDPENTIKGDVWEAVEDFQFYHQNNTYFDRVLDVISKRVSNKNHGKNFLIITDGIQDVSGKQDYSRIVNKVSDLLDAGLHFQIIAIKLPFEGLKFPEGGGYIPYMGDSPLFCYVFSYEDDFGRDLFNRLTSLNLQVKLLGFGKRNINASVTQFIDASINHDGSKSSFNKFRDELPVTYLLSSSGMGGTLSTNIALDIKNIGLDNSGFKQKTPEFCGKCLSFDNSGNVRQGLSESTPEVFVTTTGVELPGAASSPVVEYSLFFKKWHKDSKTVACDITLCNWLPLDPPEWVDAWSSDCDNSRSCFEGKTPFFSNIIKPIMNKSLREYTFGYVVIRN
jgi:hypothetical protein